MPRVVQLCQDCGAELHDCPTCGDLVCRCPSAWAAGHKRHYDKNGNPYDLSRAAKYDPEALEELRLIREAHELYGRGVTVPAIADSMGVGRKAVERWLATPVLAG